MLIDFWIILHPVDGRWLPWDGIWYEDEVLAHERKNAEAPEEAVVRGISRKLLTDLAVGGA